LEVSFSTDTDGFLSQECPSCEQRFKVAPGEGSEKPVSSCPYCGFKGQDCWCTQQQVDYIQAVAANVYLEPELKKLERQINGTSSGLFKIDMKSNLPKPPPAPIETDDPFDILHFPCCNETIKVVRHDKHFCIICGEEVDMTISDSKMIFLSHKGVDKKFVTDFKETLALLGYKPWLDDDAMPAGTSLERGLLEGMNNSCGVVFFITPDFKDEGFLKTEVDYAIAEKREKNEKFAIISLQFVDEKGNSGEIPKLLKGYVWKKPKSQLEALREIVRALPIAPGIVDWRDSITGVVTTPKTKSVSTALSDEAKKILKAAVANDGKIFRVKSLGDEQIFSGERLMIVDGDHRSVARWIGGFEDLLRRRYIKDVGNKGQCFEVTAEGYEAADELPDD
jgi:hypothetical protein